jgi:hypothetical protein
MGINPAPVCIKRFQIVLNLRQSKSEYEEMDEKVDI